MNDTTITVAETNDDDTTNFSNDQRYNDALKKARGYGREAALGADALPKLAIELVRWSKDGAVDLEVNKKAIHELYDAYWTNRAKKSVHVQGKEGKNAQVSKLKSFHTLGGNTSFDGEEVLNRAIVIYRDKLAEQSTKLKSVYAAYVDVARMANDRDADQGEPTDEDILQAMLPKDKAEKTLADIIENIRHQLEQVVSGERKDGISCQDDEITAAHDKLREWIAKLTLQAEMDALRSKLNAMGMNVYVEPVQAQPVLQLAYSA